MAHGKKVLITKVMLLFSGVAFLFLITSASKLALCGCAVTIVCWFFFLWKSPAVSDILQSTQLSGSIGQSPVIRNMPQDNYMLIEIK